jgi:hypothetical protein
MYDGKALLINAPGHPRDMDPGETGFWILNGESRLYARLERVDVK